MSSALCLATMALVVSCSSSPTNDLAGVRSAGGGPTKRPDRATTPSGGTATATPPPGGGKIVYTGTQSGSVQFGSAVCSILNGTFTAVIAPDDEVEASPKASLTSGHAGDLTVATFSPNLADTTHAYVRNGAEGITAANHNGVWTVTLSNTELGMVGEASTITLNGTLTCNRVAGA